MSASKEGNAADETDTWDADDFEVQDLGIASTHALGRQEGEVGRDNRDVISDKEKLASQKKEHGEVAPFKQRGHGRECNERPHRPITTGRQFQEK